MALGTVGSVFVDIEGDLSKLDAALRQAIPESARAGTESGQAFNKAFSQGTADVGYFDNLKVAFGGLKTSISEAFSNIPQFRKELDSLGSDLRGLGTGLSIGVTLPLVAFGTAAIKAGSDIDSLKRGLTAVAGSASEAEKQFNDLREVAKLPGLGLQEAIEGSVRLQAFGFSAGEAKAALLAFGNAVATVGGGKSELDRVIVQLGQMAGAGKVLNQDLRPIIQTVPQVASIIKEQFGEGVLGKPAETLAKLGVTSQQFIAILVRELGKLPAVTGGLKNDIENFSDSTKLAFAEIGQAMAPLVHQFVEVAGPAITSAVERFKALSPEAKKVSFELAGVAAAAGPTLLALGTLSKGASDVLGIIQKFGDKDSGLRAVALGFGEIAAAAALIHFTGLDSAAIDFWNAINHTWGAMADEIQAVANALQAVGKVSGLGPVIGFLDDMAVALRSISGLDLGNFLSLESIAKRINPVLALMADGLKQGAAALEVLNGRYKTMEEALAGVNISFDTAKKVVDANAQAFKNAEKGAQDYVRTVTGAPPVVEKASTSQRQYNAELRAYHDQLKLIGAFTFEDIKKQAEGFGAVAAEIGRASLAGIDYSKTSLEVIQAIVKIKDENEKANVALAAATEVYRQIASQQKFGTASAADMAEATLNLRNAVVKAYPELRGHADAIDKVVAAQEKSVISTEGMVNVNGKWVSVLPGMKTGIDAVTNALTGQATTMGGLTTTMENGVIVIKGSTQAVDDLNRAAREGSSVATSFGNAWSDTAEAIRDADGNIKVLTKDLQLAAQMTAQASKEAADFAKTSQGSYASQRSSAATPGGGILTGQNFGLEQIAGALAAFGAPGAGNQGVTGGSFFDWEKFVFQMQARQQGGHEIPGTGGAFGFDIGAEITKFVKIAGQWVDASTVIRNAAASAIPAINQFGESMAGVGDAERKAAQAQKDLNDATLAAGDAARNLQAQINGTYDEMQNLRYAGQEASPRFLELQTRLINLSQQLANIRGVSSGAVAGLNSVVGAVAQVAGISAGATAVIDAAVNRSIATIGEAARFLDMGPMPVHSTLNLPAIPSGPLAGAMTLGPANATVPGAGFQSPGFVVNINGGTFSSSKVVDEIAQQLTDRFRLQLQAHL